MAFRVGPMRLVTGGLLCAGSLAAQQPRVPSVTGGVTRFVPPSPAPNGFIADLPGVLPAGAKSALNARIRALQDSGYGDIGIAILPSIGDFPPFEVGLAIYRTWRIGRVAAIGSARRDLGVLLLIVPKELAPDHQGHCWVTTGTGAEGIVTDAASGRICTERIIPFLKTRDYGAALAAGVEGIAERMHGDAGLAPPDSGPAPGPGEPIPVVEVPQTGVRWWHLVVGGFLFAALIPVGLWWRRNRPRRCPKCGKKMQRLSEKMDDESLDPGQQMEEGLKSVDYDVWSCSCGESLVLPYTAVLTKYRACPQCHRRTAIVTRRVTKQPSYTARGEATDTTTCTFCKASNTRHVSLPKRTPPSTSSSSGSGFSSGSSSGGSSFGGSGSSSGGGGGSSY